MPTRNINLTVEQNAFVERVVKAGEYQNASEAIRDAVRALEQRRRRDALQLQALRAHVRHGIAALDRGDVTELDDRDLEDHMAALGTTKSSRARRLARAR